MTGERENQEGKVRLSAIIHFLFDRGLYLEEEKAIILLGGPLEAVSIIPVLGEGDGFIHDLKGEIFELF